MKLLEESNVLVKKAASVIVELTDDKAKIRNEHDPLKEDMWET